MFEMKWVESWAVEDFFLKENLILSSFFSESEKECVFAVIVLFIVNKIHTGCYFH